VTPSESAGSGATVGPAAPRPGCRQCVLAEGRKCPEGKRCTPRALGTDVRPACVERFLLALRNRKKKKNKRRLRVCSYENSGRTANRRLSTFYVCPEIMLLIWQARKKFFFAIAGPVTAGHSSRPWPRTFVVWTCHDAAATAPTGRSRFPPPVTQAHELSPTEPRRLRCAARQAGP